VHDGCEPESLEDFDDCVHDVRIAAGRTPPVRSRAQALGHREPDRLERRQVAEQLVDLEGARDAADVRAGRA
jgi:hypothetical protein